MSNANASAQAPTAVPFAVFVDSVTEEAWRRGYLYSYEIDTFAADFDAELRFAWCGGWSVDQFIAGFVR